MAFSFSSLKDKISLAVLELLAFKSLNVVLAFWNTSLIFFSLRLRLNFSATSPTPSRTDEVALEIVCPALFKVEFSLAFSTNP